MDVSSLSPNLSHHLNPPSALKQGRSLVVPDGSTAHHLPHVWAHWPSIQGQKARHVESVSLGSTDVSAQVEV